MTANLMSAVITENVELENALQQIFMECDVSTSTPDLVVSMGDELQISKIIGYIQEQLPTWSIDHLLELWKCLSTVSTNNHVNLRQFKEATKCWIAKMQQIQSLQDSNNNTQEKIYIVNDADMSMKTMGTDKGIVEFELRVQLRKLQEENIFLHDELERHEVSVNNARQQHGIIEKQLDRYVQKCQQLEKENDEQREQLDEAIKNEKTMMITLQKSAKENQILMRQLEAIEIEIQAIPSLKEKVDKISKEKSDCLRQIARLQEEFDEKENECNELKDTMTELQSTNISMKETYEYKIRNLRERNRQLTEENAELQSFSALNGYNSSERLSMSPILDMDRRCTHSTPYKSEKVPLQNSLYVELRASGFAAECTRYESCRRDLEEELEEYDEAISTISEQIEKMVQILIEVRGSTYDALQLNLQDMSTRTYNVEALKHKVAFLLNMATEEITKKKITKESSTQLRADSTNTTEDLGQFGVTTCQDLFLTRTQLQSELATNLWPIIPQCASEYKDDCDFSHDDVFLKIIRAQPNIQSQVHVITPIVEELHDIIESTLSTLTKDHSSSSSSANSRYRSIHTLSSSSKSQQSSPLDTKNSEQQTSSCQSSRTNFPDALVAQGDALTRESCIDKSALILEPHISSRKDSTHPEEDQSSEMSRANDPQVNSKITLEGKTSAKSIQTSEASGVNNSTSPRRKISVYCRSFDLTTTQENLRENQEYTLKARQLSCDQLDDNKNENSSFKYSFIHNYRNVKNDSDSSSNSTPQKQSQDSQLEDEPPIDRSIRKICLAPTRLKFPPKVKNELDETAEISDCASFAADFSVLTISSSPLSSVVDSGREKDDASVDSSSTCVIDECETEVMCESKSCLMNENFSQKRPTSARRLILHNHPAKIADSENPHSRANARRVKGKKRVERSVDSQMSSREESLAGSDSECEPVAAESSNQCIDEKVANKTDRAGSTVSRESVNDSTSAKVVLCRNAENDGKTCGGDLLNMKQRRQQRRSMRRTISEGEGNNRSECRCKQNGDKNTPVIPFGNQSRVFPSLTDIRLHESGIANLSETDLDSRENLSELELQKRYIAFSLCLCTDRVTLPQRVAMSLRQRDQTERNLMCEVQKMQQAIQELAPLCTDRESVERVERVRHQLDMIARCAHRVSCAAETLGAVHQEHRISRAVQLADRYLQVLHSRCEKLVADVAETKRILVENNIVIEENSAELGDDLPRIRYRSGTPANNRMMMARRRASVATMSRPVGSAQDVSKETVRQRNSVSGRMTLRRPSFGSESPKWEMEKLDRTDSSNSITELQGIFEQAESRRDSREENNNMRLNHSNSQNVINCPIVDDETWTNAKQEASPVVHSVDKDNTNYRLCATLSQPLRLRNVPWRTMLWGFLFFFLGFFVNQAISMVNTCSGPLSRWSIEQILSNYVQIRNAAPHPM